MVIVLDLVDSEGAGNERVLMLQRLIWTQHVDAPGTFRRIKVQGTGEMGIDAYLRCQAAA